MVLYDDLGGKSSEEQAETGLLNEIITANFVDDDLREIMICRG